jgi:hypothetical protein
MNQQAKAIYDLTKSTHDAAKLDLSSARTQIGAAQLKIRQAVSEAEKAKRQDLAEYGVSALNFLNSMGQAERYSTAYGGALDTLERHVGNVRD